MEVIRNFFILMEVYGAAPITENLEGFLTHEGKADEPDGLYHMRLLA